MAHYRDDTHEIAVASSRMWGGLRSIVEEIVKASDRVLFGLLVLHSASAAASDEVVDFPGSVIVEQAQAGDELFGQARGYSLITEQARVADTVTGRIRALVEDAAQVSDESEGRLRTLTTEVAAASDEVIGQRYSSSLVVESAKVSDFTAQSTSILIEETATVADSWFQRTHSSALVVDSVRVDAELLDLRQAAGGITVESAMAAAEVFDHLAAVELITEQAVIEDQALVEALGQAWTANTETWAMSRYAPYTYESLAVIDGVLYGIADDGVYALDGGEETIAGELRTGKLSLSGGELVHPVSAYLEYSLTEAGTAAMDVVTTQTGEPQAYTYTLPAKKADDLVGGRFMFGRGLRGRHFSFALRMTGKSGHVNDLSVHVAPTKRRV